MLQQQYIYHIAKNFDGQKFGEKGYCKALAKKILANGQLPIIDEQ